MSKITISGNAVVITSAISAEDIALLAKNRPEALNLYETEDGEKSLSFVVKATNDANKGSAGTYGIEFNGKTRDEKHLATLTIVHKDLPENNDEAKEFVADKYGAALMKLNKIEETLPAAVAEVKAAHEAVLAGIEVQ